MIGIKNKILWIGSLLALSASPLAYSFDDQEMTNYKNFDTYGGVNYKYTWLKPKGEWQNLFVKSKPGFNLYFGWRFAPLLAAEMGYEWTDNKVKTVAVPSGASLLTVQNTTNRQILLDGKIRLKTFHMDLNAFLPLPFGVEEGSTWSPEGIVSLGIAFVKPGIRIYPQPYSVDQISKPFVAEFHNIEGRGRTVFRAGLGFQTMVVENVGFRVLWRYEGTSAIRARGSNVVKLQRTHNIFHNAQSVAAGLFVKF